MLGDRGKAAEAVDALRKGIAQNADAEPILYQLLGNALERVDEHEEAIAAYERFLELAPNHTLAPAVRSIIDQLREEQGAAETPEDVNPYAPRPQDREPPRR